MRLNQFSSTSIPIETKTWLQSSTIRWALITAMQGAIALGFKFTPWSDDRIDAIVNLIVMFTMIATSLLAAKGRMNSTEIIVPANRNTPGPVGSAVIPPPQKNEVPPTGMTGNTIVMILFLIAAAFTQTGCFYSKAEHVAFRETIWAGTSRTMDEHVQWASVLAGDTNADGKVTVEDGPVNLALLPQVGGFTLEQRNAWLRSRILPQREARALIESDRSQTAEILP
jgi:hypothetical protein